MKWTDDKVIYKTGQTRSELYDSISKDKKTRHEVRGNHSDLRLSTGGRFDLFS